MRKNTSKRSMAGVLAAFLLCVMMLSLLTTAVGAAFPKAVDGIADQAGQLSESTIRQIKKTNETLKEKTGCAVAVCTVLTTGDTPIGDYAKELFLDWKLGEGVLLLIAAEDTNYYLLQSSGVDKVLTNDVLSEIRDEYLEENFAAGNVDRAVLQCVSKIAQNLFKLDSSDASDAPADSEQPAEKKTSFGSFIVGFFKAILYIILIAAVLFIAFFIFAMFNDDAANILQKYVFQRGNQQKMPEQYYDSRLYGDGQRSRSNPMQNRGQNPNSRRPQNGQNPYAGQRMNNGQRPQNRQNPNGYLPGGYPPGGYPQNRQSGQRRTNPNPNYPQQNGQPRQPQAPAYSDSGETRSYTIPGRGQNR